MRLCWLRTSNCMNGKTSPRNSKPPMPKAAKLRPVQHTRQYLFSEMLGFLVMFFVECAVVDSGRLLKRLSMAAPTPQTSIDGALEFEVSAQEETQNFKAGRHGCWRRHIWNGKKWRF